MSLDLTYASEFWSMIDERAIFSSGFSLESQHTPRKVQNDNLDNWKEDGYDTGVDDEVVEN